ncbi:hypothetical protein CAEBREN_06325 [Caenorhabditis brenneri]|uniref:Uncharacterized protein n=1 Tax=Caenorhabditis brenneri TaxID=135651 RepID=G0MTV7_CAEBE|nr:hypothetical protein CAEBREN_06325 [Caenorhabditis brenneri]
MAPAKKDTFRETWKSCWEKFEASRTETYTRKAESWAPKNSMAWTDMKKGRIVTDEKLRQVALPSSVCRMLADDARYRTKCEPTPLMSLNVLPPSLFFQSYPEMQRAQPLNEKQILDVLSRVNTILRTISQALNVSVCASVERRNADNSTCLFTYFDGFPWTLVGGMIVIDGKDTTKPPPPHAIYDVWRNQFFNALQAFIPPPILSKMKRCVDYGSDMITFEQTSGSGSEVILDLR